MSGESFVDAEGVDLFLQRLARCYRRPGKVYLVGGTSLLLVASKEVTRDIDLQFSVEDGNYGEFVRCLRQVGRELKVPVEQVSPAQFIPLPAGYETRHRYVGRFEQLEVFHFDFYSIALSKLHRGNEKDFSDVMAMLRSGLIKQAALEQYFDEIFPELDTYLTARPDVFRRNMTLLQKQLSSFHDK